MPSLIHISRKIKDMQSILKIAESLELISSFKLKSYRDMRDKGRDYVEGLKFLFKNLYCSYGHSYKESNSRFVYTETDKERVSLWIVIGSDLSLCGSFNKQIINFLWKNFPKNGLLVIFGKKLFNLIKNTKLAERIIEIYPSEIKTAELISNLEVISTFILKEYISKKYFYLNLIFQKHGKGVRNISLLPFTEDYFGRTGPQIRYDTYQHRLDPSESIVELFPVYLERTVLVGLLESKIAEHNQRRELMTNAVKAAEEKLDEYKLVYQKLRQAKITQEISEITSALKLNIGT